VGTNDVDICNNKCKKNYKVLVTLLLLHELDTFGCGMLQAFHNKIPNYNPFSRLPIDPPLSGFNFPLDISKFPLHLSLLSIVQQTNILRRTNQHTQFSNIFAV
jgi:hypothetical protein